MQAEMAANGENRRDRTSSPSSHVIEKAIEGQIQEEKTPRLAELVTATQVP
jgi:hypothetical protein